MKKNIWLCLIYLISTPRLLAQAGTWEDIYTYTADSLIGQKRYDDAYALCLTNVEKTEKEHGKNQEPYIVTIIQLAEIQYYRKNYSSTIDILTGYIPTLNKTHFKDSVYHAQMLNMMGISYRRLNQLDKAEQTYKSNLLFLSLRKLTNTREYNTCLNNLAAVYETIGKIDEAIALATTSLAFSPKNATKLGNLAMLYKRKGRFKEAIQMAHEALNNTPTSDKNYIYRLNTLALIYTDIQFTEKAIDYTRQALDIVTQTMGKNAPEYVFFANNLASFYNDAHAYEKALPYAQETVALEEVRKTTSDNYYFYVAVLAETYCQMGELDKALPLALNSVAQTAIKPGKKSWHYFNALRVLALIYEKKGDLTQAIAQYQAFLDGAKTVWSTSEDKYITILKRLVPLYNSQNQSDKSTALLNELAENMNTQVVYNIDILDEYSKELFIQKYVKDYTPLLFSQCLRLKNNGTEDTLLLKNAYEAALAMKGVILSSNLIFKKLTFEAQNTEGGMGKALLKDWLYLKERLAQAYAQNSERKVIDSLTQKYNTIEEKLIQQMPELQHIKRKISRVEDIKKQLSTDACAVEFVHFPYHNQQGATDTIIYAALVIRPDKPTPHFIPLCTEKELDQAFAKSSINFYKNDTNRGESRGQKRIKTKENSAHALKNSRNTEGVSRSDNDALYALMWQPIEHYFSKNTPVKTIYYTPSGRLHQVAFAALPVSDTADLSDTYRLNLLSSTREILTKNNAELLKKDIPIAPQIALFGGIQYGEISPQKPNTAWAYLEGTKREINKISTIFKEKGYHFDKKEGIAATEESFKMLPNRGEVIPIIHIATHGFFYKNKGDSLPEKTAFQTAQNPLIRTGLIMANANPAWQGEPIKTEREDGILTAYEISNLDLNYTQLVVLSACETGLGDVRDTEGVYGLQRAFKMAGVEYILMSLWQVPDKHTTELMTQFYTYLCTGMPISDAFNTAQKRMKERYAPYYWAGFVLMR
jgi:CHAT domain-containing protein/Tfp pilus assembly protein PilF